MKPTATTATNPIPTIASVLTGNADLELVCGCNILPPRGVLGPFAACDCALIAKTDATVPVIVFRIDEISNPPPLLVFRGPDEPVVPREPVDPCEPYVNTGVDCVFGMLGT